MVSDTTGFAEAGQHGAVDRGGVVADGVLAGKEDSGRILKTTLLLGHFSLLIFTDLNHVVSLSRVSWDDWSCQDVIIIA